MNMARLVILVSCLCVCLVLATEQENEMNSWMKLKMALLRRNQETATKQIIGELVKDILSEKSNLGEAMSNEGSSLGLSKKSNGWRSFGLPIQTRFAAFGSKLMPSREGGDHGSTLLRYGRSA